MSKFYYNGVLLPDIPTEHLATNPYVFIRKNNTLGTYDLVLCASVLYYSDSSIFATGTEYWYRIPITDSASYTEWEFYKSATGGFGLDSSRTLLWSNSAIKRNSATSTTIYFPKCELLPYTESKLLYNDVKLPALPIDYLATNPFVWIRKNVASGYYDLLFGASYWYYGSSGLYPYSTDSTYWYRIPISNSESYTEWEFYKSNTGWFGLDSNRTVFWTLQDIPNGSSSASVYFSATSPTMPDACKYLVRNNDTIYTVSDNVLVEVTGTLNAQLFQDSGVSEIPSGTLLMTLSNPEVLCWQDSDTAPKLTATVQGAATGSHDIISDNIPIGHESIYGMASIEATASEGATFSLSFDNGSYMVYDTDSNTWVTSDVGMTTAELVAIPANAWTSLINEAQIMKLKATLDGVDTVTQVKFNFNNES